MEEVDPEVIKKFYEAGFDFYTRDTEKRLDFADAYAHAALKSLFLVNGGSIISLLTFIGNGKLNFDKRGIFWAFSWFAAGICSALISYFCAYLCQNFFMRASSANAWAAKFQSPEINGKIETSKDTKLGNCWIGGAIFAAFLSFALFVTGIFVALVAIT